jgi:hypothetical protein
VFAYIEPTRATIELDLAVAKSRRSIRCSTSASCIGANIEGCHEPEPGHLASRAVERHVIADAHAIERQTEQDRRSTIRRLVAPGLLAPD